jgi:DNA-binding XRE family transcriptional regulator
MVVKSESRRMIALSQAEAAEALGLSKGSI